MSHILNFGKFKGMEFSSTPLWYQSWLLKQDWFNPSVEKADTKSYALIENGVIHTDDLTYEDALEMQSRYARFFPDCHFSIMPTESTKGLEKAEGMLERHMRIAVTYSPLSK